MNWCIVVLKDRPTVVLREMASNHWPQLSSSMSMYFRAFILSSRKSNTKSVKCNASPKHYTKSLRWRWRGAGWYCSPALLHYVHPVIEPNFYIRFIAEYHSIPVTIYRQVPLSSASSYPVSLVDLPNPNHLTNNTYGDVVACFEHSLHSTFRRSSVSVLI